MGDLDKSKTIQTSKFISKWKKEMRQTIERMYPEYSKDEIESVLDELLEEQMQVPEVELDNNFTGENRETNLISVLDWVLKRKPIMAGNATFYKPQYEAINPVAQMIDGFLKERKRLKKLMFSVEDKTSDRYKDLDRA